VNELLQLVINGVVTGLVLALGAAGISMVFGVLRLVNFAAGDYISISAFVAVIANIDLGVPFWFILPIAALAGVVLSLILDAVLWRPLRKKRAGTLSLFLAAIGVALILRQGLLMFAGSGSRKFDVDLLSAYDIFGARIALIQIYVLVIGAVTIVVLLLVMSLTAIGRRMRAYSDNSVLAAVSGINLNQVVLATWIISGSLMGITGVMQGLAQGAFDSNMGWALLLPIFAAVTLGSIGNVRGALVGGLVLGLVMELSTWSIFMGGVPGSYKPVVAFVVLAIVLIFRPQGLFGTRARVV
jgi:branched-subunit amino acid ABC-type transport system permease component